MFRGEIVRNAMIVVSVMLALYLGWPLAFGGPNRVVETPAEARGVGATAAPQPGLSVAAALASALETVRAAKPETCYKRYRREVNLCDGASGAACRLGAADHWDMCEATGFWPK